VAGVDISYDLVSHCMTLRHLWQAPSGQSLKGEQL
jgi:hypothetical protein